MKKQTKEKKFFMQPDFKKLQSEWYSKLADDGFSDIESMKDIKNNNINPQIITVTQEWAEYNQKCLDYLMGIEMAGADSLDQFIFQKHCEGVSTRGISKLLESTEFKKLTFKAVSNRLNKILDEAGIERVVFNV